MSLCLQPIKFLQRGNLSLIFNLHSCAFLNRALQTFLYGENFHVNPYSQCFRTGRSTN